jgi:hypothetical protein
MTRKLKRGPKNIVCCRSSSVATFNDVDCAGLCDGTDAVYGPSICGHWIAEAAIELDAVADVGVAARHCAAGPVHRVCAVLLAAEQRRIVYIYARVVHGCRGGDLRAAAGVCSLTFADELGSARLPFRVLLLWVMIQTPCHELVRALGARNPVAVASLTALLMTLADLTTDPLYATPKLAGNVVMKLWHWSEPTRGAAAADRRVYGVPMNNFLWWWVAGFVATLLIEVLVKFDKAPRVQISRNKLLECALQCLGWLLNGVFFATLYDVPPGIRFTATMGMIVPSTIAGLRLFFHVEWRQGQRANRATTTTTTTTAIATQTQMMERVKRNDKKREIGFSAVLASPTHFHFGFTREEKIMFKLGQRAWPR